MSYKTLSDAGRPDAERDCVVRAYQLRNLVHGSRVKSSETDIPPPVLVLGDLVVGHGVERWIELMDLGRKAAQPSGAL